MKRTDTSTWACTIARATAILGDSWNVLILREAFYGNHRFDQLQEALGISRNILTDRLAALVDERILEKAPYQDGHVRYEYLLTKKGRDTFPILLAMAARGRAHTLELGEDPLIFEHATCGHDFDGVIACSDCGEPIELEDVSFRRGPGYVSHRIAWNRRRAHVGAHACSRRERAGSATCAFRV